MKILLHQFKTIVLLALLLSTSSLVFAQTQEARDRIKKSYNQAKLNALQRQFEEKAKLNKEKALQMAKVKGWPVTRTTEEGQYQELISVTSDGEPIYYTTFNAAAARSTRAIHLNSGGSLGLNLNGQNMIAHVWDGGLARSSHQEYDGAGGTNRYSIGDGTTTMHYHSAHVTGTIIASGVVASAKGMAPHARAIGYEWNNDLAEATTAAANGMILSNHSYGYRSDLVPDWYFGAYIDESRDWDELLFNSPFYLMVVAAGNDGSTNYNALPLNGNSSYDKLTGHATSKNNLVVANAQDANIDADGNLVSVLINSGSSQGPTDDLRIKPDIAGNGTSVYSTYETGDAAYASISGTSMASPNVTGTLLLLQQHYNNLNGVFMRAATLKGLALHTADDAGSTGPDARFGWGLLNAKKAAQTISQRGTQSVMSELTLSQGQTYTTTVQADGINKLIASICWTDPAGTPNTGTANLTTPVLVNNLDIRVTQGSTTYNPYRLTSITSSATGDNNVDPYERVDVASASGTYTITVTHKGTLQGGSQNFSLIITGITTSPTCTATVPTGLSASGITTTGATLNWTAVSGATYDVQYRATGTSTWTTVSASTNSIALSGLSSSTQYEARVRSKCTSTTSAYSASVNFTTLAGCIATVPTGLAASGITSSGATLNWNAVANATYDVQYRVVGGATWTVVAASTNSLTLSGLTTNTQYEAQVRSKCSGTNSAYSVSANFTTSPIQLVYCTSRGNNVSDEYIGRVQLGTINNLSGSNAGYGDFTAQSTNLARGSSNTITVTPTWTGSTYPEGYAVWIDYNKDGDFTDSGELVWSRSASTTTPVSGTFTVPSTATLGATRMRVSMKWNGIPTSCETFSYGEVEDYTVNITAGDTQAPSAPTNLAASSITQTSANLSWTASTDNVGVTGYDVRVNGTLQGSPTGTTYALSGLTAGTTYSVSVTAKDAAGNMSTATSINVTTLAGCTNVTLTLTLDNYPDETRWNIRNSSGTTIASGGPYSRPAQNGVTITSNSCLSTGCYTFNITDSYGDGICCSYGNGSYTLRDAAGNTLASGGSFGSSMTHNFCVGGATQSSEATVLSAPEQEEDITGGSVYPNPVKGNERLNIAVPNSVTVLSVQILATNGVPVTRALRYDGKEGIDVSSLMPGMYIITIRTDKSMITRKFIKQ
jgi:trimeric autotransporter adhesin